MTNSELKAWIAALQGTLLEAQDQKGTNYHGEITGLKVKG